jgi:hypothetical protein
MKILDKSGFLKIASAMVIVTAGMMTVTCDDNKDKNGNDQLMQLMLLQPKALILFNAGTRDGNMGGRSGADGLCKSAKPSGVRNPHAFLSVSDADPLINMPSTYKIPIDLPVYGPDGITLLANNWAALMATATTPLANSFATAGVLPADKYWYSGSNNDGTFRDDVSECVNFTSNSGSEWVWYGYSSDTSSSLTATGFLCDQNSTRYLLCIGEK